MYFIIPSLPSSGSGEFSEEMTALKYSQALVCLHVWAELQTKTAASLLHVLHISTNDVDVDQHARSRRLGDGLRKLQRRHGYQVSETHTTNISQTLLLPHLVLANHISLPVIDICSYSASCWHMTYFSVLSFCTHTHTHTLLKCNALFTILTLVLFTLFFL